MRAFNEICDGNPVTHVCMRINPKHDSAVSSITVDGVHQNDPKAITTPEGLSEAIKRLKPRSVATPTFLSYPCLLVVCVSVSKSYTRASQLILQNPVSSFPSSHQSFADSYLLALINKYSMDQALIFCRTKLDCNNLERFLTEAGGGGSGMVSEYDLLRFPTV